MKKRPKPSNGKKGATVGIVICFVAAVIMAGTYTLRDYQESQRQELAMTEDTDEEKEEKEELSESANTDKLVIDGEEDTDKEDSAAEDQGDMQSPDAAAGNAGESAEPIADSSASNQVSGQSTSVNFTEDSQILWPVNGNVLLNYSMDQTVYFATLDQYKYNPAMIISGAEGDQVICGAAGIVKSIDVTAQTGTTVNVDLGNGYELFYGQLKEVPVKAGDYVEANTIIGYVSQPTKYYSVEGCNVYFEMRKDGQPVNPLDYIAE